MKTRKPRAFYIVRYAEDSRFFSTEKAAKKFAESMKRKGYDARVSYRVVQNPKDPPARVKKALAKYVKSQVAKSQVALPKEWTDAQVRVDEKGNVKLRINPRKLSSGVRFAKNVQAVKSPAKKNGKKPTTKRRARK